MGTKERETQKRWMLANLVLLQRAQAEALRNRPPRESILALVSDLAEKLPATPGLISEDDLLVIAEIVDADLLDAMESEGAA